MWVAEWQAVPWMGLANYDGLDSRGNVPLARYRFSVEGKNWTISSNPFQVIDGGLVIGTVVRANGNIRTPSLYHAPKGYRVLDSVTNSNVPVPIRSQPVSVTLRNGAGVALSSEVVTTDGNGVATVANNANATQVQITDRFGNTATATIP
jgi:hypothetical protein